MTSIFKTINTFQTQKIRLVNQQAQTALGQTANDSTQALLKNLDPEKAKQLSEKLQQNNNVLSQLERENEQQDEEGEQIWLE